MAQRDVDVKTGLSAPNLAASSFVRQGVVDKSGLLAGQGEAAALGVTATAKRTEAVAIENLSKVIPSIVDTGLEIYKGHALAQLQQEQNKEIDDFLAMRQNPELAKSAAENAASLDLASHSLWDKLGKGQATIGDLDANLEAFDKETQALRFANQQGVIQPSELQTRLLAITRKHINNNPGLSAELLNHAEKILSLSGVGSLRDTQMKLDNAAQKAFQQQKSFVLKEASKHNVEIDAFRLDDPDYLMEVQDATNARKRNISLYTNITESDKLNNIQNAQEGQQFLNQNGAKLLKGGLAAFHMDASAIVQSNKDNPEEAIRQIKDLRDQHRTSIIESVGGKISLSSGEGKFYFDTLMDGMDNTIKRLEGDVSGKDKLEILNTQHNITEKLQEMSVQDKVNVPWLRLVGSSDVLSTWVFRNPEIQDALIKAGADIFHGNVTGGRVAEMMKSRGNTPGVIDAVGFSKAALDSGNGDLFMKSVKMYKDISKSGQMTQDDVFNFMDSFTDSFSQPNVGQQARQTGSNEAITDLFSMGGQYIGYIGRALESKTQGKDVKAVEVPGVGIRYVVKGDAQLESELNDKYARRVNRMIKTFANIGGWSIDQAWNQIKDAYVDVLKLDSSSFSKSGAGESTLAKKIIGVESSGNPNAKNPNSTATGLGQFTNSTWLSTIKSHFPDLAEGKSDEALLKLRTNPEWSKKVLDKHIEDNKKVLSNSNIPTTDTNLYLAHFLGAQTAVRVLNADPSLPTEKIIRQDAITANKSILAGKTVGDVIKFAERKMS